MKKIVVLLIALISFGLLSAQTGFNYKALITQNGTALANHSVNLKFTILQNGNNPVYQETHSATTDANGIVSVAIGEGSVLSGDFADINWADSYFLKVEIDTGSGFEDFGTSELKYVPKAKFADKVGVIGIDDLYDAKYIDNSMYLGVNAGAATTDTNLANVGIGHQALSSNITGSQNTATGNGALYSNTTGHKNTAIGYLTLYYNTIGFWNSALGYQALLNNTSGTNNNALGYQALFNNYTGSENTAIGFQALYSNADQNGLVAIGHQALYSNVSGYNNTAVGNGALYSNTTGLVNTAIGFWALHSNTTGNNNTAVGSRTLYANTTGTWNTGFGIGALYSNTTGETNTASGCQVLISNISGNRNTASGFQALHSNVAGDNNTASGFQALHANDGDNNTAYGYEALHSNIAGNNNTAIGYNTFYSGTNYQNSTALGAGTFITASNQVRLGNSPVTSIGGYANWTNVSDARFKTGINEDVPGLDFIIRLRPVTYHLDMDAIARFHHTPDSLRHKEDERAKAAIVQSGFIAQEVEQAAEEVDYDFSGVDAPKNDHDHYGLRYAEFTVPLVKATQELNDKVQQQEEALQALKAENQVLKAKEEEQNKLIQELNAQIQLLLHRVEKLEQDK